MKKWPTPNPMTLRTKGAEKNANNLGTFLENIPIPISATCLPTCLAVYLPAYLQHMPDC